MMGKTIAAFPVLHNTEMNAGCRGFNMRHMLLVRIALQSFFFCLLVQGKTKQNKIGDIKVSIFV